MPKAIAVPAFLMAAVGVLVSKIPHMHLAALLASGEIDASRIPVTEFVPASSTELSRSIRLGELILRIPEDARISQEPSNKAHLLVEMNGLTCTMFPPRRQVPEHGDNEWSLPERLGPDELSRRIAVCTASREDFSLWASASEIDLLRERLVNRPIYCLGAERVEVFRGEALSGLLLIWKVDGAPRMLLEYFSTDGGVRGSALLVLDSDSPECTRRARALLSTFNLQPEWAAPPSACSD